MVEESKQEAKELNRALQTRGSGDAPSVTPSHMNELLSRGPESQGK